MSCPNTNLPEWKLLVASRGEDVAYALWDKYNGEVPESESRSEIVKAGLKATNILQSPKADQFFNAVAKNKITGDFFWRKMQADLGIPKDQLEILKSFNTQDRGELISSILANYSFAIEINTAKTKIGSDIYGGGYEPKLIKDAEAAEIVGGKIGGYYIEYITEDGDPDVSVFDNLEDANKAFQSKRSAINSSVYANLTVPGGTNYTENEIATSAITPSIKGHAQFATDQGIGWFRSDEQVDNAIVTGDIEYNEEIGEDGTVYQNPITPIKKNNQVTTGDLTKTRRILEVQSDLFQKGRDQKDLTGTYRENVPGVGEMVGLEERPSDSKGNQFLQLLNKDSNWVTFFVKSIIQDSAKKGYEKVLFPSGDTASKVEGHTTLEEFKKGKQARIKLLEEKKDYINQTGAVGKIDLETGARINYDNQSKESIDREIEQLKKELEDIEGPGGFGALKPIYNFYENTVKNVLNKQYGKENVKQVTDEYGNTWNEVDIKEERDLSGIYFQTNDLKPSQKEANKIFFDEVYNKNLSELDVARINKKLKAISDRIGDETWQLRVSSSTGNYYVAGYKNKLVTTDGYYSPYANGIFRQTEGVPASKASKETLEKVKKVIDQMGVNIVSLQDYLKGNPDVKAKDATALADLVQGIIAVAEGKEDVALTEEMVHIATAIIEQVNPQLVTNLIGKISQYKIYNIVLEKYKTNKAYQLPNGKPNIRKIKKEAVDKLIAEMIINMSEGTTEFPELLDKESRNLVQQMWDAILSAIRSLYGRSDIDLFEQTAQQISEGNLGARYYNEVKPGVEELFNDNPELADIGTQEQYSAYIDSIFPDSQVKDIVYHGTANVLDEIEDSSLHFSKYRKDAEYFSEGENIYSAIINHNNPVISKSDFDNLSQEEFDKYEKQKTFIGAGFEHVVMDSKKVHILGNKQDVEGFKSFMQTAPAEFKGEGVFFQLEENQKVNDTFNKFKDMDSRMNLSEATENEKRHYTYDGKPLDFTVTTLKKKKDLKRTDEEKLLDDQKKAWGTEGHNFLERYIKKNLISKDGYALLTDREEEIDTPLNDDVKKSIVIFAKELIESYPAGTRFLVETQVANLKVKGGIGSKIDFMAFEPIKNSKGQPDVKVDILDWKFTSFNTESNLDIPWYKQDEWKEQMGEYTKMAYNLGVERNQLRRARMIPFVTNYRYAIKDNKTSGLVARSVEIGKLDSTKETNVYLLPVPVDFESTGNETVDAFISNLRKLYEKMYKSSSKPEEKFSKNLKLEQLSLAIRNLHLKLNFFPIYDVAKTFLNDMELTIKEFDGIDYNTLSKDELNTKLKKLIEYQKSAEKFTQLSDVYISQVPRENMSVDELKLLNNFDRLSAGIKRKLKEILSLQQEYVFTKGLKEGVVEEDNAEDILKAEKLVSSLDKNFLESSKLSPLIIQLAAKVYLKAKNLINVNFSKVANNYSKILIPLEQEAKLKGKPNYGFISSRKLSDA
jgi:hypothetical protein